MWKGESKSIFKLFSRSKKEKLKEHETNETNIRGRKISETTSEDTSCDDLFKNEQSQAVDVISEDIVAVSLELDGLPKNEQSQDIPNQSTGVFYLDCIEKIEADQKSDVSDQNIGGEYAGQKIGGSEELYAKIG